MSGSIVQYIVPGIVDGSVYGISALGLVITYKTSGVFNFAHGAMAAAGAYTFYEFHVRDGIPWPLAVLLTILLVGFVGGLLIERLASKLSQVPTVNRVVATVGLLVFIQGLATALYGYSSIVMRPYLPTNGFTVKSVIVSGGDIAVTVLALATAVGLYFFFAKARLGLAMTAVVDNPDLVGLQGLSPEAVRRIAWIMGSSFAGITGMLLAPKIGVSVTTLILLVIAAYGAAAIGLFDSLLLTFGGGIVIGLVVNLLPRYTQDSANLSIQALPGNTPFLVLFAVLVLVPRRKLIERGVASAHRLRPIREYPASVMAPAMLASGAALLVLPFVISKAHVNLYASALGYTIIFVSLALITWTSGQISLCHLGFAAIGATTTGHLLSHGMTWPLAVLLGGLVAVPAGAVVSIPAIRLSGIYVAIATFGFGILLQQIVYPSGLMFGVVNNVPVPRPRLLGIDFTSDRGYYYLALMVTVIACAMVVLVRRSRLGRLLRALSDSADALDAHGANTNLSRIYVFVFSAFLAAIGGAVVAGVPETASGSAGSTFDFTVSLVFVAVLGFCGRRPLASSFLAAFLYQVLKTLPGFSDPTAIKWQLVGFGALAMLSAIWPALAPLASGRRQQQRDGRRVGADRYLVGPTPALQPTLRRSALVPDESIGYRAREPVAAGADQRVAP